MRGKLRLILTSAASVVVETAASPAYAPIAVDSPFDKHLIFHRVEDTTLVIFRVLHGMRDLPRRLLEPPGQED